MTQVAMLGDGRLHLQHGPIDLLCRAWGLAEEMRDAYQAAAHGFPDILPALCAERAVLSAALRWNAKPAFHPAAQAMCRACLPYSAQFITPMAAVAGAVADVVLGLMLAAAPLRKAYVNNRGDIAFHMAPGESLRCGVVTDLAAPSLDARLLLTAGEPSRGVATSGRACKRQGGRSFSLGIADSVTILARSAAEADAAATVVGNAVDLDHPGIERRPAWEIDPDSDLEDRMVTWSVPLLAPGEVRRALDAGLRRADGLVRMGLIDAAFLALQGQFATTRLPERQAA